MPNICTKCGLIVRHCFIDLYKLHHKAEGFYANFVPCPNQHCSGSIISIDENILPIIKLLWQKGYKTRFCCSGHVEEIGIGYTNNAYITFGHNYKFKNIPSGFLSTAIDNKMSAETASQVCMISKVFENKTEYSNMIELAETMQTLYKWAESLPEVKGIQN